MFSHGFPRKTLQGQNLGIGDLLNGQSVTKELGKESIRGFSSKSAFALTSPKALFTFPDN